MSKSEKLLVPKHKTIIFEDFPYVFEEDETLIIIVKIYGESMSEILASSLSIKSKITNGDVEGEFKPLYFFDSKKNIVSSA